ncbi:hypothetical protein OOK12_27145 [Streptomyces sp. NBC_00452]|uniref:hypothetical protein n=1 Tax=Streptomyces sp. NBC_00452 TaxID=2975746 RepID=UPI0022585FCD|nr:hypothetical protein [Streptomyces sp. NBC_00452]MCX5060632.1 hypothetical protein [Streptomyces sp. NBC_00452]
MTDSSFNDDGKLASSPIRSVSDGGRQRSRRRVVVGGAVIAAALVVGGGTWLALKGGSDDNAQRTPGLPSAFGAYKEASAGDTEWTEIGSKSVNTDIIKGPVSLTYRASAGRALMISVKTYPLSTARAERSDETFTSIFDSRVDRTKVKNYPAGAVGGKIQCADIKIGGTTFTTCGWHNLTTEVKSASVLNHNLVVSTDAPADLRTFINALQLTSK